MEGSMGHEPAPYTLPPFPSFPEDILFCIDVDLESMTEMKSSGPNGRPVTRLDAIKHAILLFVYSKLEINPEHRFSFSFFAHSASRLQMDFSNDVEAVSQVLRPLTADASYDRADLTPLFRLATQQAKKSQAESRILRVILIYCRSSVIPEHHWAMSQKLFTLDVVYLHDRPAPGNCPQKVYDTLVEALEKVSEYEGYIFETGQGLARVLFKHMCVLLSHAQQRCVQDDLDIPKPLVKKVLAIDATPAEEGVSGSNQ